VIKGGGFQPESVFDEGERLFLNFHDLLAHAITEYNNGKIDRKKLSISLMNCKIKMTAWAGENAISHGEKRIEFEKTFPIMKLQSIFSTRYAPH
jgi:hypothetical protein